MGARRTASQIVPGDASAALLERDPEAALLPGATNALTRALGLSDGESLLLVADRDNEPAARAFVHAAVALRAKVSAYLLDETSVTESPAIAHLAGFLGQVDASIVLLGGDAAALRERLSTDDPAHRQAHLPATSKSLMTQSMRSDWTEVDEIARRVGSRLVPGARVEVTSPTGSRLTLRLESAAPVVLGGRVTRGGERGWLPAGLVQCRVRSVDGVIVPDGGAFLPDGTEAGRRSRLCIHFSGGAIERVDGKEGPRVEEAVASLGALGRRIGLLGVGANPSVLTPVGEVDQDTTLPGCFLGLGPAPASFRAVGWNRRAQAVLLTRRADVWVNGSPLVVRGRLGRDLAG